jgi:hypothetical protein
VFLPNVGSHSLSLSYMHTYIHFYIHTCIFTYIHAFLHTHIHTHIYAYIQTLTYVLLHTYKYIYTYKYIPAVGSHPFSQLIIYFYSIYRPQFLNNEKINLNKWKIKERVWFVKCILCICVTVYRCKKDNWHCLIYIYICIYTLLHI